MRTMDISSAKAPPLVVSRDEIELYLVILLSIQRFNHWLTGVEFNEKVHVNERSILFTIIHTQNYQFILCVPNCFLCKCIVVSFTFTPPILIIN